MGKDKANTAIIVCLIAASYLRQLLSLSESSTNDKVQMNLFSVLMCTSGAKWDTGYVCSLKGGMLGKDWVIIIVPVVTHSDC